MMDTSQLNLGILLDVYFHCSGAAKLVGKTTQFDEMQRCQSPLKKNSVAKIQVVLYPAYNTIFNIVR